MTIHTINPEIVKEQDSSLATKTVDAEAQKSAPIRPAQKDGSAPAEKAAETASAKRFSRDVGKKLPPDVGSQEPI
ncbi:hypothetical protein [Undibacterium terreum]|uniref:Uncharacterized protein n=1 Tax=Undibacterium terreum TaxID=1224302 RepID=A0A916U6C8_9BURK|nr:hypothetical protein [Undibacterium terreum]GGC61097.1 hypothetical protein GCM10011396_05100 [Undibacterium terreum]